MRVDPGQMQFIRLLGEPCACPWKFEDVRSKHGLFGKLQRGEKAPIKHAIPKCKMCKGIYGLIPPRLWTRREGGKKVTRVMRKGGARWALEQVYISLRYQDFGIIDYSSAPWLLHLPRVAHVHTIFLSP